MVEVVSQFVSKILNLKKIARLAYFSLAPLKRV